MANADLVNTVRTARMFLTKEAAKFDEKKFLTRIHYALRYILTNVPKSDEAVTMGVEKAVSFVYCVPGAGPYEIRMYTLAIESWSYALGMEKPRKSLDVDDYSLASCLDALENQFEPTDPDLYSSLEETLFSLRVSSTQSERDDLRRAITEWAKIGSYAVKIPTGMGATICALEGFCVATRISKSRTNKGPDEPLGLFNEQEGTDEPLGEQEGTEPSGEQEGTEPSGEQEGTEPSGEQEGTEPSGEQEGTDEPSGEQESTGELLGEQRICRRGRAARLHEIIARMPPGKGCTTNEFLHFWKEKWTWPLFSVPQVLEGITCLEGTNTIPRKWFHHPERGCPSNVVWTEKFDEFIAEKKAEGLTMPFISSLLNREYDQNFTESQIVQKWKKLLRDDVATMSRPLKLTMIRYYQNMKCFHDDIVDAIQLGISSPDELTAYLKNEKGYETGQNRQRSDCLQKVDGCWQHDISNCAYRKRPRGESSYHPRKIRKTEPHAQEFHWAVQELASVGPTTKHLNILFSKYTAKGWWNSVILMPCIIRPSCGSYRHDIEKCKERPFYPSEDLRRMIDAIGVSRSEWNEEKEVFLFSEKKNFVRMREISEKLNEKHQVRTFTKKNCTARARSIQKCYREGKPLTTRVKEAVLKFEQAVRTTHDLASRSVDTGMSESNTDTDRWQDTDSRERLQCTVPARPDNNDDSTIVILHSANSRKTGVRRSNRLGDKRNHCPGELEGIEEPNFDDFDDFDDEHDFDDENDEHDFDYEHDEHDSDEEHDEHEDKHKKSMHDDILRISRRGTWPSIKKRLVDQKPGQYENLMPKMLPTCFTSEVIVKNSPSTNIWKHNESRCAFNAKKAVGSHC